MLPSNSQSKRQPGRLSPSRLSPAQRAGIPGSTLLLLGSRTKGRQLLRATAGISLLTQDHGSHALWVQSPLPSQNLLLPPLTCSAQALCALSQKRRPATELWELSR